jgi:hypothetical protein
MQVISSDFLPDITWVRLTMNHAGRPVVDAGIIIITN